ncbi:MAG: glycosyltransferase family 39 protein [Actinomycetota bacterium]|nr:glycosyltransferase family 39 protein [Actinomycetota bacterium]
MASDIRIEQPVGRRLEPIPRAVWVIAGIVVATLIVVAGRYGFHRDELYFIAAGRRLAWGFVDQPPLTPLLARLGDLLPGAVTPSVIRIVPALSAGGVVVLTAFMARRFGGGKLAITMAALFAAGGAFFLAVGHLLSTTTFDVLIWAAVILVMIMILDDADRRWWLAAGALVGLGLTNKYMIIALVGAVALGIVFSPRRQILDGWWPWVGAHVALVIAIPNLLWQNANNWPQLEMARSLRENADGAADYILLQIAILSLFLVIPAVAGWRWLWRDDLGRRWQSLATAFVLLFLLFAATGGKGYYVAPLYLPLFAAGSLWVERLDHRKRIAILSVTGAGIVAGLFLALPLVPPESVNTFNEVNTELGETYGWNQLVDQVEAVYMSLPAEDQADAVIFTSNYGQAGAIEVLGAGRLPQPISGHNNYWLWGPGTRSGPIIGVGFVDHVLTKVCPKVEQAGTITNEAGVDNDENGTQLWLCREPTAPLSSVWDDVRHYN